MGIDARGLEEQAHGTEPVNRLNAAIVEFDGVRYARPARTYRLQGSRRPRRHLRTVSGRGQKHAAGVGEEHFTALPEARAVDEQRQQIFRGELNDDRAAAALGSDPVVERVAAPNQAGERRGQNQVSGRRLPYLHETASGALEPGAARLLTGGKHFETAPETLELERERPRGRPFAAERLDAGEESLRALVPKLDLTGDAFLVLLRDAPGRGAGFGFEMRA